MEFGTNGYNLQLGINISELKDEIIICDLVTGWCWCWGGTMPEVGRFSFASI